MQSQSDSDRWQLRPRMKCTHLNLNQGYWKHQIISEIKIDLKEIEKLQRQIRLIHPAPWLKIEEIETPADSWGDPFSLSASSSHIKLIEILNQPHIRQAETAWLWNSFPEVQNRKGTVSGLYTRPICYFQTDHLVTISKIQNNAWLWERTLTADNNSW